MGIESYFVFQRRSGWRAGLYMIVKPQSSADPKSDTIYVNVGDSSGETTTSLSFSVSEEEADKIIGAFSAAVLELRLNREKRTMEHGLDGGETPQPNVA